MISCNTCFDVSVIIVNYNTWDLVYDCISSIYEKTIGVSFEIIVIDNNSINKKQNILEQFPDVRIYFLSNNIGFGKANNEGVKVINGKYVFFLNSDTILLNNVLFELYRYMEQNNKVGICGGNLYTLDLYPNMSYSKFPSLFKEIFSVLGFVKQENNLDCFNRGDSKAIDGYISGANIFLRCRLLENIAFDPDFFMYYEDVELSYRIRRNGYEIHSVPDAKIVHLQGMSSEKKEMNESLQFCLIESKLLYFRKTSFLWIVLYLFYSFKSVLAIFYFSIIGNDIKKKMWYRVFKFIFY